MIYKILQNLYLFRPACSPKLKGKVPIVFWLKFELIITKVVVAFRFRFERYRLRAIGSIVSSSVSG